MASELSVARGESAAGPWILFAREDRRGRPALGIRDPRGPGATTYTIDDAVLGGTLAVFAGPGGQLRPAILIGHARGDVRSVAYETGSAHYPIEILEHPHQTDLHVFVLAEDEPGDGILVALNEYRDVVAKQSIWRLVPDVRPASELRSLRLRSQGRLPDGGGWRLHAGLRGEELGIAIVHELAATTWAGAHGPLLSDEIISVCGRTQLGDSAHITVGQVRKGVVSVTASVSSGPRIEVATIKADDLPVDLFVVVVEPPLWVRSVMAKDQHGRTLATTADWKGPIRSRRR